MKRISLILSLCVTACTTAFGQIDTTAINRPINLLNSANQDIENGDYEEAVQKLIASIRLNPQIRAAYLPLNTACSYTAQISILKSYLLKAKEIFREDDEICYYLGNIFQKENNFTKAIQAYTEAIKYAKQNGEDYELVYAYYQNRGACYLKTNQFAKAIPDFDYAIKLNPSNGAAYTNRGIAHYQTGNRAKALEDWRKAADLGISTALAYLKRYGR